jgi:hypothetical protein
MFKIIFLGYKAIVPIPAPFFNGKYAVDNNKMLSFILFPCYPFLFVPLCTTSNILLKSSVI